MVTDNYQAEQLLLAIYGESPAFTHVLHDSMFIYDYDGDFKPTYGEIFTHQGLYEGLRAVKESDLPFTFSAELGPEELEYYERCVKLLNDTVQVVTSDLIEHLINTVTTSAVVYGTIATVNNLTYLLDNPDQFNRYTEKIANVYDWVSQTQSSMLSAGNTTFYRDSVEVLEEVEDRYSKQFNNEMTAMLPTYPGLQSNRAFLAGKYIVLHGMSGMGKSAFSTQMLLNLAISLYAQGLPGVVALHSLEMGAESQYDRMVGMLSGVDTKRLLNQASFNGLSEREYSELQAWANFLKKLPLVIDDSPDLTVREFETKCASLHITRGPLVFAVTDYAELFTTSGRASREQEMAQIALSHRKVARRLGTTVMMLSQSTYAEGHSTKTRIAGAEGTRYSKSIRNTADEVWEIWNGAQMEAAGVPFTTPEGMDDNFAYILIQKNREAGILGGGKVPFEWQPTAVRFLDHNLTAVHDGEQVPFVHLLDCPEALKIWNEYHTL